jgi:predicted nucleic acid-binding Zn ribbon protein
MSDEDRRRRNVRLALIHVGIVLVILAGFFYAQVNR